jgi:hypothetical protein
LQKKVVGFRLIEVKHSGENIAERIASVVEEFGLFDKVFAVTLDNISSHAKEMETLTPMFFGYLGSYSADLHLHLLILIRLSICLCINVMHVISLI